MTCLGVNVKLRKYFRGFISSFAAQSHIHSTSSLLHRSLLEAQKFQICTAAKITQWTCVCVCVRVRRSEDRICVYKLPICREQTMRFLKCCHFPHSRRSTDHVVVGPDTQQLNLQAVSRVNLRKLIWQLHRKKYLLLRAFFNAHSELMFTVQCSIPSIGLLTLSMRETEAQQGTITAFFNPQ